MKIPKQCCAYCGEEAATYDHVVSRALYPGSKAKSRFQRIKVPACTRCNASWVDDEPHFRNVLMVAGDPNAAVRELWEGKVWRSFHHADGLRRVRDLARKIEPVETAGGPRHIIYPGRDERVLRIVRKVVRGLCYHHGLLSPLSDDQVFADIHRFAMSPAFLEEMTAAHAEDDILEYRYAVIETEDIHSAWLLTFYGRTPFLGLAFRSPVACRRARVEAQREAS
ncbi:hypothetical protein LQG66_18065 [Bradyrhizobium ontarionense]|uniref:HNH endonuclease 5 domain-containing protein n=1 Tax=Bradyrhizobium ontarionense TaxID=2898149 RepID=A0ABY3RL21_9BRAD|nr:hypothetical protein [Bradyrhizobium sp. A19]UFZ08076.1 hypothetical protein LQG66_18065 [Bradyrhizobium sp. A19]